jgi:hypothetical protein
VQIDAPPDVEKRSSGLAKDDDIELAVIAEKSKPSAGWMVEQRVLVTATPASKQETPASEAEQEPEQKDAPTPPVRCATPEQEPWNSTPVAQIAVPAEPEVSDIAIPTPVRSATPEPETHATTPDVTLVHEQTSEQATASLEEETSEAALAELASSDPELENAIEHVPTPNKSAPVQLLDLPPGTPNHGRLVRIRANPTQRSETVSMSA